ncbi:hypothetical protein MUG84_03970 [Paenibacillus sp. KQZ6P-2]|uniref:SdpI/YhfL protein family n=1 Tax=Paenibacillus mangrovi TaxID=2931978 RepID=A0A9X1WKB8_9BACL|nr:hypothetical protein [Paenibacillus mangrovi]MCJ8010902.1 hypothetical protein [Paenibacillus mangrovi]
MDIGNLVIGVIVGLIYFTVGLAMKIKPSHDISSLNRRYGISRPAESEHFWRVAGGYSANLMMLIGAILIVISVVCSLWVQGTAGFVVILAAAVALAVLMIVLVERRLRKTARK